MFDFLKRILRPMSPTQKHALEPMEYDVEPKVLPSDWKKFHADKVARLDPALVLKSVQFLRLHLAEQLPLIREMIAKDPQKWWVSHHFGAMRGIRNILRGNGFGEKEFGIDNLDDYAVGLVEMAAETIH